MQFCRPSCVVTKNFMWYCVYSSKNLYSIFLFIFLIEHIFKKNPEKFILTFLFTPFRKYVFQNNYSVRARPTRAHSVEASGDTTHGSVLAALLLPAGRW